MRWFEFWMFVTRTFNPHRTATRSVRKSAVTRLNASSAKPDELPTFRLNQRVATFTRTTTVDDPITLTVEDLNRIYAINVPLASIVGEGTSLRTRWEELTRRYELTKPFASRELKQALAILNMAIANEIENRQPLGLGEMTITKVSDVPEPNDPSQRPPWHDVQVNPMVPPPDLNEKGEPPTPA